MKSKIIKLQLTVNVDYEAQGTPLEQLKSNLEQVIVNAMSIKYTPIQHPCPFCGREEEGKWFIPCPSSDCPSHDTKTCAVCSERAITTRCISINNGPKKRVGVCEIHADAADEDAENKI